MDEPGPRNVGATRRMSKKEMVTRSRLTCRGELWHGENIQINLKLSCECPVLPTRLRNFVSFTIFVPDQVLRQFFESSACFHAPKRPPRFLRIASIVFRDGLDALGRKQMGMFVANGAGDRTCSTR